MYTSALVVHAVRENETVTIEELNEELFVLHIPALVFVAVSMVIGVLGNVLVIYIYQSKFQRSNHRYFILCLAAIDLTACLTGLPYLILSLRRPYLMPSVVLCKSLRYVHYFVNNSSALLLVVISVERFWKICLPLKRQLSNNQALGACVATLIASAVIAVPAPIFFGKSTIATGIGNLSGEQCYIADEYKTSPGMKAYVSFLFVETVIFILILAVMYGFVIRRVWSQEKFIEVMKNVRAAAASNGAGESSVYSTDAFAESDVHHDTSTYRYEESTAASGECTQPDVEEDVNELPERAITSVKHTVSDSHTLKMELDNAKRSMKLGHSTFLSKISSKSSKKAKKWRKRTRTTRRVTIMLFTISLTFVLAFIPHLILIYLTVNDEHFLDNLTADQVIVYQFFLRIFIINNIANPIIYGLCDKKFRASCMTVLTRFLKGNVTTC